MPFEHMTPLTPETLNQAGAENKGESQSQTQETKTVESTEQTKVNAGEQTTEKGSASQQETQPDKFFDEFNKRFSTQYKTDEEIKGLFTLPGKVTEYEGKLKDFDTVKTDAEKYKKELEDTKTTYMSDLLSKPLMKQAFVASQLQEKYPDRDKDVLAELAMSDIDKMSDLEIVARERKMDGSKSSIADIRAVIVKSLGVDPEQKPEEWDSLVKTELELKATDARRRIKQLLQGIELPKIVTKEEREKAETEFLEARKKQITPVKEIFGKFDEYQNGDFKFAVPDEFKQSLSEMFDGMFLDSGLEVNEKNIATAELLKKALFLEEYLPKILEVRDKETEARLKKEYDDKLNNTKPINTATAEPSQQQQESGVSNYLRNPQDERAKRF